MTLFLFERITVVEASRRRVHKHTTIQPSTPDSDSLRNASEHSQQHQKPYRTARPSLKVPLFAYELIPAIVLLIIPFSVHAGVFSSFMDIFADEAEAEVSLEAPDYAPHTTPLLNASKNPDPLRAVGGGDVFYDEAGVLVSTGPIGADEISASKVGTGEISVYVVREGDALSQIAEMYGVTTNTILWANDLSSASAIQPGDTLVILPIVGVRHTVLKGETLSSILKKYDADLEEVLDYNNLASADAIAVGDELMIPGGQLHTSSNKLASAPTPTKTSGGSTASGAGFSHPLPGSIRTQGIHGYNGVDLAASAGTPVLSAGTGTVIVAKASGWNGGYGNYVVIKHANGAQTLYAHLSTVYASVGEQVGSGEQIGIIGNTGKSTGIHLHFEVRGGTNPF